MPNVFTLADIVPLAAARLAAQTPVYRLTAQATLADAITGITAVGQSVRVLIPDPGVSRILPAGGTTTADDLAEGFVTLTVDTHFYNLRNYPAVDAAFKVARNLPTAVDQGLGGSIQKIGEDIDAKCLDTLKIIPYWVGSPGTAIDTKPKAIAGIPVIQKNRGWSGTPVALFSPDDYNTVSAIDAFSDADRRGAATTVNTGLIGRVWGIDWLVSRAVDQPTDNYSLYHIAGTLQAGSPLVNGAVSATATSFNVDGGAGTETLKVGDLFTVAGVPGGQFSIVPNPLSSDYNAATETYTASGGAITGVGFYPPAPTGGFANDAALTFLGSHTKNYLLTPGTLASVVIPPINTSTLSSNPGQLTPYFFPSAGIGLALTTYERSSSTLGNLLSVDTFAGGVLIRPERAVVYVT